MRNYFGKLVLFAVTLAASSVLGAGSPPTVLCSADQLFVSPNSNAVEAVVSATIQDAEGDALTVQWSVNGGATNTLSIAGGDTNAAALSLTNSFELGTNHVQVSVSDDGTNFVSCLSVILVDARSLPALVCSPDQELDCAQGLTAVTTATIQELDGQALHVEWFVNGQSTGTLELEANAATNAVTLNLTNSVPVGTNLLEVVVTDTDSNVVQCASQVVMRDTTPPVIRCVKATPNVLWPVNHKLINVCVRLTTEDCSAVTWRIAEIRCNEAVNMRGSGHTSPDWYITGPHQALLRAERSGTASGRIYTLCLVATDASGNTSRTSVQVTVPHDQRASVKSQQKKVIAAPQAKKAAVATKAEVKFTAHGKANAKAEVKGNGKAAKK